MAMGLRPLDMDRWLEIDERREEELELKADLLASTRDVVVATRPEGDAPSEELHREVCAWLDAHGVPAARPVVTGDHPVVSAARLVQEDLCVLVRDDVWRLQAACVCFPSRWSLATKIGRSLDEIHSPIPGYATTLAGPTNGVFDRMTPERSFWRLNWTVIDDPALHQPHAPAALAPDDIDQWYFRVERQTIRRLVETGAVVFTIHNYVSSVADLRSRPEFLEHLLLGIDGAPVAMQEYKGWVGVAQRLRDAIA